MRWQLRPSYVINGKVQRPSIYYNRAGDAHSPLILPMSLAPPPTFPMLNPTNQLMAPAQPAMDPTNLNIMAGLADTNMANMMGAIPTMMDPRAGSVMAPPP